MGQQPLSVLKDDVEVSTEPTRASVVSDAAHQLHHLPLGRGSSALVELERIDDVEVHAVESGVEDAVQIGVWAAEDEALPSRIPVANLVVSRPFGIFDVEPGRRAAGPILSPVEAVVFGLADAHVRQHDPAGAIEVPLHHVQRGWRERRLGASVGRVVDDRQIEAGRGDGPGVDPIELVHPGAHLLEWSLLCRYPPGSRTWERQAQSEGHDRTDDSSMHVQLSRTEITSKTSRGKVIPATWSGGKGLTSTRSLTRR